MQYGFAFQNILQNFLARNFIVIFRNPSGWVSWIAVTGLEGKVEDIQARATIILDSNSKRIVIPNAILFTNPVIVGEGILAGQTTVATKPTK